MWIADAATGAKLHTVDDRSGRLARWTGTGQAIVSRLDLLKPDGQPLYGYDDCNYWDPATQSMVNLHCYYPNVNAQHADPQCSPGNCLSGIALRSDVPNLFEGLISASGALTGDLVGSYLFAKARPGTHGVTLALTGGVDASITCDDGDSSVSGRTTTYRVQESEIVTCTAHSHGPIPASSKSFRSNTSRRSGEAYRPKVPRCASESMTTCTPLTGPAARSRVMTSTVPRKKAYGDWSIRLTRTPMSSGIRPT